MVNRDLLLLRLHIGQSDSDYLLNGQSLEAFFEILKQYYLGEQFKHTGDNSACLDFLAESLHDCWFRTNDKLFDD